MKTLFRIFNVMFFSAALVFAVVSMTFAASLPDGLTELQYIEVGKKTAYIDTGVTINKSKMPGKYRQVLRASWVLSETNGKQYCGASNVFSLGVDGSTTQANIIVSNGIRGPGIQSGTPYTIDATYDIKSSRVSFSVDGGTEYTGSLPSSFTDGAPFTVFADSGKNSVFLPGSRVYSYQLYIDDDLVVDLVPVQIIGGDVVGMYDTVSRGLFERRGDGSFVPGPEVVDTSISQVCTAMIKNAGLGTYYYDGVNSSQGKYTVAAVMQTVPNASSLLENVPETCTLKCQDPTLTLDFGALNNCMQGDASACSGICVDFVSKNGPCRNNGEKYNYKGDCVMTTYQDSGIDLGSWAGFVDNTFGIPAGYVDASDYPHACPKLDNVMSDADSGRCVCKDGGWFDTTTGTCLDSFVIDFDDKTSMTVSLENAPTTVASSSMGLFDTFGHLVFDNKGKYAYGISGDDNSYISTDVGNPGHVFASAGKSASSASVVKIELLDGKGTVSQNIYYVPKGSDGNYYFTDEKLGKPLTGAVITGIPTITGYTFGGYFSQKNAGGTKYVDAKGAFASNWWDGSSLTVQMQPFYTANTITLDLRPEGSTVKTTTCTYDSSFVLPTPTERSGYTFNGWLMPDGKTYAAGTSVTCNNALLGTDDGTTKSIGASWTPKSAPAGSCPGSFFDYENKEWIQDYTCEDVGQNLIGEGFDHNVLTDGCSCMCDPFDAAFNPVAANACMKGETDACADVCIPLDQPCDYGQRPYVVDGIAQCGYYFDPEFGLIDYYGSQRWGEFLDGNGMSAGYMSPTGELLPCDGDGVKEAGDGTGRCVCTDGGWFLMDGGRCVQELSVDLMLDPEGTQNYANVMLDFLHNPFNLVNEGYGLPDGGAGLTLDQIMDMVNGQGTQMFDNNGEWTYTPMGTETQYIYKSIPLVGYPVYSGTPAPVVVKVNLDFQGGNPSWSEFYYVYGRTTPGPFFNSSSVQTPINNSVINKPTRTGYTFGGYYTSTNGNGQQYVDENGAINDNLVYYTSTTPLTLYAKWTPNTYTISYNLNSGTHGASHPTSATYDTSFTVSNPTRSGYTFSGWKITGMDSVTHTYGNSTTASNSISSTTATTFKNLRSTSGTVTFTAQWTSGAYTVTLNDNGGTGGNGAVYTTQGTGVYIDSNHQYSMLSPDNYTVPIPTKVVGNQHYAFLGYYGVQIGDEAGLSTYPLNDQRWIDATGHITADGEQALKNSVSGNGVVLYARYTSVCHPMDIDNSTYCGSSVVAPPLYMRTVNQYVNGGCTGSFYTGYEYYDNVDNCVSSYCTGNNNYTGSISAFPGALLSSNVIKANSTYKGHNWLFNSTNFPEFLDINGNLADATAHSAGASQLYAICECNVGWQGATSTYVDHAGYLTTSACVEGITITLNDNGGSSGSSAIYTRKGTTSTGGLFRDFARSSTTQMTTSANPVSVPTRENYTFDGYWSAASGGTKYIGADGKLTSAGLTAGVGYGASNTNVMWYAHWTAKTYTVSFNTNGGTGGQTADVTATYGAAMPTLGANSAPTRTGYYLVGWYDNSDYTASGATQYYNWDGTSMHNWDKTANTTLYAGWDGIKYTITLDDESNGGTSGSGSVIQKYALRWTTNDSAQTTITSVNIPKRTNSIFNGYYSAKTNGTQHIPATGVLPSNTTFTSDTTLYAQFSSCQCSAGTGVDTCTTSSTTSNTCTATATCKVGYEEPVASCTGANCTSSCTPQKYTISIKPNGGKINDSVNNFEFYELYNTEFRDLTDTNVLTDIPVAVRDGYSLTGYFTASTGGTLKIGSDGLLPVPSTFMGDTTLYAQWAQDVITCTAGNYLPANSTSCATCPAGYYCPNTGNYVQSSSNQGIVSCASGKITETAGATSASQCKSPEFSMTTTSLAAGTVFSFTISAKGNFVIDWGDGNIQQITRTNTTDTTYSHTYTTAGTYTIGMSGQATGYNSDTSTAAIGFMNNTKIAGISGSLGAIFGTLSSGTVQPCFFKTFNGCSRLTGSIPENLFTGISGAPVVNMFAYTFYSCSNLTGPIPEGLFRDVSGAPASSMFSHTFDNCRNLTGSIPAGLFAGISGAPKGSMFYYTFNGCSGLTGFVPQDLFVGITNTSYASGPMANVFNGTGLATACPAGYYQYITGFEADFNSKVACTPCPTGYTSGVGATANTGCYLTVDGGQVRDGTSGTTLSTCAAGTYKTSHNEYYGTSYSCDTCPTTNPYSPAGAADAGACGRKLHIGDNVMYLRSTQKTTPSLKFDFNKDGVADLFGNMSTSSKTMSSGVDKSFKVNYGGQVYYIHDDTVQ